MVGRRRTETLTDDEGHYRFDGAAAGGYELSVMVGGKHSHLAPAGRVTLVSGEVVERVIRIASTRLSGRVIRADTGAPFGTRKTRRGRVDLQARQAEVSNGQVVRNFGRTLFATTDAEGHYTLCGLAPGFYEIRAPSPLPGYSDATRLVNFSAGGRLGAVDFALEPRRVGVLRLRVVMPDGSPARHVTWSKILKRTSHRTVSLSHSPKEVETGVYEVPLAIGRHKLTVWGKGTGRVPITVTIFEGQTIEEKVFLE